MYLRLKLRCECGMQFEIDNNHQGDIVCPNCHRETLVDNSSRFQIFLNSTKSLRTEELGFSIQKIKLTEPKTIS